MKKHTSEFSRTQRINEQIKRELSSIIQMEVEEPNLGMLTVSLVEVSPDLKQARIYISIFNSETGSADYKTAISYLNGISKRLRYHLSQRLNLRVTPELKFIHDAVLAQGNHLLSLIESLAVEK